MGASGWSGRWQISREGMFLLLTCTSPQHGSILETLIPCSISQGLAQQIVAGAWTEKTALDLKDVPKQTHGNDCGVFMIMYAWYFAMDACFDFGVDDMCLLRRWWCIVLLENFGLEGYGRKFAHFTDEGKATLRDNVPPVFRITRKRKLESPMNPQHTDPEIDHMYCKRPYSFPSREQVQVSEDRCMTTT
ncbi:uncharacterized protein LOC121640183 isoform X2 [Melanotaenia boesemani]|uniref:uncharacterized protein LOC121640183 isoform X2 n=1 Tax=Melanotaenia boesemani TaxID=1250792 RepID=UPI001C04E492|nr:uncharacterized protein LOC121640183 isoform X2 [Melanotaenia boesemani]